MIQTLESEIKC